MQEENVFLVEGHLISNLNRIEVGLSVEKMQFLLKNTPGLYTIRQH